MHAHPQDLTDEETETLTLVMFDFYTKREESESDGALEDEGDTDTSEDGDLRPRGGEALREDSDVDWDAWDTEDDGEGDGAGQYRWRRGPQGPAQDHKFFSSSDDEATDAALVRSAHPTKALSFDTGALAKRPLPSAGDSDSDVDSVGPGSPGAGPKAGRPRTPASAPAPRSLTSLQLPESAMVGPVGCPPGAAPTDITGVAPRDPPGAAPEGPPAATSSSSPGRVGRACSPGTVDASLGDGSAHTTAGEPPAEASPGVAEVGRKRKRRVRQEQGRTPRDGGDATQAERSSAVRPSRHYRIRLRSPPAEEDSRVLEDDCVGPSSDAMTREADDGTTD